LAFFLVPLIAGAMTDFSIRTELQDGQLKCPLSDCSSNAELFRNQPSNWWPRWQRKE
jgi:hypothetical protein